MTNPNENKRLPKYNKLLLLNETTTISHLLERLLQYRWAGGLHLRLPKWVIVIIQPSNGLAITEP